MPKGKEKHTKKASHGKEKKKEERPMTLRHERKKRKCALKKFSPSGVRRRQSSRGGTCLEGAQIDLGGEEDSELSHWKEKRIAAAKE